MTYKLWMKYVLRYRLLTPYCYVIILICRCQELMQIGPHELQCIFCYRPMICVKRAKSWLDLCGMAWVVFGTLFYDEYAYITTMHIKAPVISIHHVFEFYFILYISSLNELAVQIETQKIICIFFLQKLHSNSNKILLIWEGNKY